jgi:hypothetical protein
VGAYKTNSKWWLLALLLSPPIILLLGYKLQQGGLIGISITKGLFYASFLLVVFGMIQTLRLVFKREIGIGIFLQSLIVLLIYSIMPIGMMVTKLSQDKTPVVSTKYAPKANLRTLLFAEPHYVMTEVEKKNLLKTTRSLNLGYHYTDILRLLPPVPEDCPIIMKTLDSGEMVLVYFIRKKLPSAEVGPGDHHITLKFNREQNLMEVEEAI